MGKGGGGINGEGERIKEDSHALIENLGHLKKIATKPA